jgi:hypothetical protein
MLKHAGCHAAAAREFALRHMRFRSALSGDDAQIMPFGRKPPFYDQISSFLSDQSKQTTRHHHHCASISLTLDLTTARLRCAATPLNYSHRTKEEDEYENRINKSLLANIRRRADGAE